MIRLFVAALLAVFVHVFLLIALQDVYESADSHKIIPGSVTMTLSYRPVKHDKKVVPAHTEEPETPPAAIKPPKKRRPPKRKMPDPPEKKAAVKQVEPAQPARPEKSEVRETIQEAPPEPPAREQGRDIDTPAAHDKPVGPVFTDFDKSQFMSSHGPADSDSGPLVKEARPLYKKNPPPVYPRMARRRGYEGTVVLSVRVSPQGEAEKVSVSTSSGYRMLDRAALGAVKEWLFEPGIREGKKVAMWVKVPVRFELR